MSANENKQPLEGFQALIGELDTLTKALPAADVADDKKIEAAAADGDDKPKLDKDGKPIAADPMTKSFKVTLDDGSIVDAEDGTELVKSLLARVDNTEQDMIKALGGTIDLVKALSVQLTATTELAKSLQTKVNELSGEGRGRKTMVSIHEKLNTSDLAKSESAAAATNLVEEFMTKSHAAFAAKKITGLELTSIDVAHRQGFAVEPSLVAKVLASA